MCVMFDWREHRRDSFLKKRRDCSSRPVSATICHCGNVPKLMNDSCGNSRAKKILGLTTNQQATLTIHSEQILVLTFSSARVVTSTTIVFGIGRKLDDTINQSINQFINQSINQSLWRNHHMLTR